ncbi:uncharacterized protein LOC144616200 [Panthera onca]
MGAEKKLLSVKETFQLAQQPHRNQAKFEVALSRTYCKGRKPFCTTVAPKLMMMISTRDPEDERENRSGSFVMRGSGLATVGENLLLSVSETSLGSPKFLVAMVDFAKAAVPAPAGGAMNR